MADKKKSKLIEIIKEFKSSDPKKISKAIKSFEVHGDSSVLRVICDRLLQGDLNEKNTREVLEFMSSLKDSTVAVEMIELINDDKYLSIRQPLLTTVWNMKVDFSGYIDEFVHIAVFGDFMETLECLTIIENMDGPFMEEDILESQLHLKRYLEGEGQQDKQKAQLLSEVALLIKDINEGLTEI
jgi:hypothetical protein